MIGRNRKVIGKNRKIIGRIQNMIGRNRTNIAKNKTNMARMIPSFMFVVLFGFCTTAFLMKNAGFLDKARRPEPKFTNALFFGSSLRVLSRT